MLKIHANELQRELEKQSAMIRMELFDQLKHAGARIMALEEERREKEIMFDSFK